MAKYRKKSTIRKKKSIKKKKNNKNEGEKITQFFSPSPHKQRNVESEKTIKRVASAPDLHRNEKKEKVKGHRRSVSFNLVIHINDKQNVKNVKKEETKKLITEHFVRRSNRVPPSKQQKVILTELEKFVANKTERFIEARFISEEVGKGVFATCDIAKDSFICEYSGDLLSHKDAVKREELYVKNYQQKIKTNQTIANGCYMYFFEFENSKYCIDCTVDDKRLGRLINHSCKRNNLATRLFKILGQPRLLFFSNRDIKKDEELLFDYGDRSPASIKAYPWLKT